MLIGLSTDEVIVDDVAQAGAEPRDKHPRDHAAEYESNRESFSVSSLAVTV
jgi:hypothetical protein